VKSSYPGEPDQWLALIHIEIESPDKATTLRSRMFYSYANLRQRHSLPVLPIALFLKVGLDGIGIDRYTESFWEQETVVFQYNYVGLPALDALEYVHGENWLGWALSALMKIPKDRVIELGLEALRRIGAASIGESRQSYLNECLAAYLPL